MGGSSSTFSYDESLLKDQKRQVVEVDGSQEPGFSPVYRNSEYPEGFEIPSVGGVKMDNVWAVFDAASNKFPDQPCMGFRPYEEDGRGDFQTMNYTTVKTTCEHVASGLYQLGARRYDTIGLYAKNRAEWFQVHLANTRQGYQTTALYDTLGDEAVAYILMHAEVKIAFCEPSAFKNMIASLDNDQYKTQVETIVVFDHQEVYGNDAEVLTEEMKEEGKNANVRILGFSELIKMGSSEPIEVEEVDKRDVCFLMYTSGTTGTPKGVQIPHEGFCMITHSVQQQLALCETDRHLSFLPLAHIFECLVETVQFAVGGCVYYYQGNIRMLTVDWQATEPTIVIGVPRVFGKVYDKVMAKVASSSCIKKMLFNKALNASAAASKKGQRNSTYDNYVWKGVAAQCGFGKVRYILSGAAPLPPYLAEFLRIVAINGEVFQGYGLTETTGGSVVTSVGDVNLGHVGCPLGGVDIRLEDIPDMNYMTTDENPRGEILIRAPSVMLGYLKNPEKTAETIVDGWLHTGDVGRVNPNGTLSIIDRKKNLFKTSYGEYIAVEKVEAAYQKGAAVNQIWVYGNSFKSFIVAVVVPDALWAKSALKGKGLWKDDENEPAPTTPEFSEKFAAVCRENMEVLKELVHKSMKEQEGELKRFEKVKDIMLEVELDDLLQGFNVENGLLTPSFKTKRPCLLKKYVDELKALYDVNGEAPKADEHWVPSN